MNRAEHRRMGRLMGYRGTKAKRDKAPNPIMVRALQEAVKERLEEIKNDENEKVNDNSVSANAL